MHLWANAVLALIYHPELLKSPSGVETPLNRSMSRSIKLALASSRQISECMVFADLVANTSYVSAVFVIRADMVDFVTFHRPAPVRCGVSSISTNSWILADSSRMALIHEMRAAQASASDNNGSNGNCSADIYFFSMARQNLQALIKAVELLEQYWAGVTSVASILERRKCSSRRFVEGNATCC